MVCRIGQFFCWKSDYLTPPESLTPPEQDNLQEISREEKLVSSSDLALELPLTSVNNSTQRAVNNSTQRAVDSFNKMLRDKFLAYERILIVILLSSDFLFIMSACSFGIDLRQRVQVEEKPTSEVGYYMSLVALIIGFIGLMFTIELFSLSNEMIFALLKHNARDVQKERISILKGGVYRSRRAEEKTMISKFCCDNQTSSDTAMQAFYFPNTVPPLPARFRCCYCFSPNWSGTVGHLKGTTHNEKIFLSDSQVKKLCHRLFIERLGCGLSLPGGLSLIPLFYLSDRGLENRNTKNKGAFYFLGFFSVFCILAALIFLIKERLTTYALLNRIFHMRYKGTNGFLPPPSEAVLQQRALDRINQSS